MLLLMHYAVMPQGNNTFLKLQGFANSQFNLSLPTKFQLFLFFAREFLVMNKYEK